MPSILETYEALHGKSKVMAAKAARVFPSGVTHDARAFHPFPIYVQRAQGPRKWDIDGNEYVDFIGGHGALLLGHNRPEVMDAARAAMERGTHFGSSHDLEIMWGQQVIDMVPCAEKVRFTSSGTEATMMALRLARAYTGRERIIKLPDHFHGWNDLLTGRTRDDDPLPFSVGVPAAFYSTLTVLPADDIPPLREALATHDIAAVILEPTGAHWGTHPLSPAYLREARKLTDETGTLFIMDEVITGFRMAPGGAQQAYDITPDLYHRPLETLLATFGISIALQQLAKNIFGTQARPLTSPEWLGGALTFNDVISISYIRIAIFVLALIFLALILFVLKRTRLGLEVRAVTQNPGMAASMGINPDRINVLTFGLGSGIAGIAGVAIGLYAKVTSEMGADYIVQSFMTVVVGGVGNVWGTLAGASLIGFLQKGIEWLNPSNTLAAQTYMILFIILFIQFRPKGIVALKGRAAAD